MILLLTYDKGTTLAVVGESGSGKTTLAKSIMRFYELTEGMSYSMAGISQALMTKN